MAALGISQHHLVLSVLVHEVVIHAFLFHQPADEVEIALAILHTVVARLVGSAEAVADLHGAAVFVNHLLDDFLRRLVLEDLAVVGLAEGPKARVQDGLVCCESPALSGEGEVRHIAMEESLLTFARLVSRLAGIEIDFDRDFRPKQVLQCDLITIGDALQLHSEHAAKLFLDLHSLKEKLLVAAHDALHPDLPAF